MEPGTVDWLYGTNPPQPEGELGVTQKEEGQDAGSGPSEPPEELPFIKPQQEQENDSSIFSNKTKKQQSNDIFIVKGNLNGNT